MKSSEYWQRRFDELEAAQLRKAERYNAREVDRQFQMALAKIEKELSYWYQRLGENNSISANEARKLLAADELREFHWNVEEYIQRGKESNYSDKWKKMLENASAKMHISRLDAMKLQIQQQIEVLYGNQVDGLDELMHNMYTEGFNRSAYTLDTGIGVHYNLATTDPRRIDAIINRPWADDGKTFSERLWRDKDKLVNALQQEMTQAVTRGDKLGDAVKNISKRMGAAKSSAARLVMTESAFISGRAQRDCFKDLGVDKYEYVATLDRKTSETCRDLDGKVFDIDDYKPGTNAPPMHCWCRSCIVPYFDDMEMLGKRAARDPETGKTILVPESMTYRKWEKTYANTADRTSEIASAGRKKVFIEEENIDKLPYFKYYGKNKEQSININNVQKELLNDSRKENNSNETVYVLDQEGKRQEKVYGTSDAVSLPLNVRNMLDSGKNMMLLHNHPAGSSFSVYDISCLLDYKGLSTITLVTNGCDRIEALTKTAKYDHEVVAGFYNKLLKKVKKNLDEFEKNVELHDRFVQIFLSYVDEKGYISWRK